MCEPVTLGIMAGASLLGAGASAYSQYQQGQFAKEMGERNAQVQDAKALEAVRMGSVAEERQRAITRQTMGAQRAAMAGTGLEVDSGSFGDILADTAKFGELDAQTVRTNALKEAWGLQTDALDSRIQGRMAGKAVTMNAAGTLLSGASQAFGMYKRGK